MDPISIKRFKQVAGQNQKARDDYLDEIKIPLMPILQLNALSDILLSVVEPEFQDFKKFV